MTDLNKLRQKLEQLKNPKLKTFEKKTWSPDKEKTKTIRFLKDPNNEDPFREVWIHYGVGYSFLCPRTNSRKELPSL